MQVGSHLCSLSWCGFGYLPNWVNNSDRTLDKIQNQGWNCDSEYYSRQSTVKKYTVFRYQYQKEYFLCCAFTKTEPDNTIVLDTELLESMNRSTLVFHQTMVIMIIISSILDYI